MGEDNIVHALNKVILDHLDTAGFIKVAKMFRDELSKP